MVQWLLAVQSQDYGGAKWGVAQRTATLTDQSLDAAFDSGQLLRTHLLRPTWHFVVPADLRWLLHVSRERVHQANGTMYRKLKLDPKSFGKSTAVISKVLGDHQPHQRDELRDALQRARLQPEELRFGYQLMHAELEGLICSGPRQGKQHTYRLVDDCCPPPEPTTPSRDELLHRLASRFYDSHGPATPTDLAWWSGLTLTEAKRATAMVGKRLETIDERYLVGAPVDGDRHGGSVHLLPNYDEFLVGYRDRAPTFDPTRFVKKPPADAFFRHLLVLDGQVVGGWTRTVTAKQIDLVVTPYIRLRPEQKQAVHDEGERYAHFYGLPVSLTLRG